MKKGLPTETIKKNNITSMFYKFRSFQTQKPVCFFLIHNTLNCGENAVNTKADSILCHRLFNGIQIFSVIFDKQKCFSIHT